MQVVLGIWQTLANEHSKDCVKFRVTVGSSLTVVKKRKYSKKIKQALEVPETVICDQEHFPLRPLGSVFMGMTRIISCVLNFHTGNHRVPWERGRGVCVGKGLSFPLCPESRLAKFSPSTT